MTLSIRYWSFYFDARTESIVPFYKMLSLWAWIYLRIYIERLFSLISEMSLSPFMAEMSMLLMFFKSPSCPTMLELLNSTDSLSPYLECKLANLEGFSSVFFIP